MDTKNIDYKKVGLAEIGWWQAHNVHDKEKLLKLLIKQHVLLYSLTASEAKDALISLFKATQDHDTRNWDAAVKNTAK